jgi:hypothetical protein
MEVNDMPLRSWPCAEPRCPRKVEYRFEQKDSIAVASTLGAEYAPAPLYLTCGLGHTHAYAAEPSAAASL